MSIDNLRKIYIEPTTLCNLDCRTCIRHTWNETQGHMPWDVFQSLMEGLDTFPQAKTMSFAGFGEPLFHPRIVDMIRCACDRGMRTEMTSNGILLTPEMANDLINAGLNQFVVSIDGADDKTFGNIRSNASLREIIKNVKRFQPGFSDEEKKPITIGVAFVAMKSNIKELPKIYKIAEYLNASFVMVSNVLPYTAEMEKEGLFQLGLSARKTASCLPALALPKFDWSVHTEKPLSILMRRQPNLRFLDLEIDPHKFNNHCPFIQAESLAVSWDGRISPCVPLLHSYSCYARGREKRIKCHHVGQLPGHSLQSIWNEQGYEAFRRRVRNFDFPPCPDCDCYLADNNEADCQGNPFPVCGDCLWARGIIRCP